MAHLEIDSWLKWMLATTMLVYVVGIYGIAWFAQTKVHNNEDYIVAGRRLPWSLSWMTILATWFGAGTLLAVADEVRREGVRTAALDPVGAGCCLLFVGAFVAAPMWRLKLLTVSDYFAMRWGRSAELLSAGILVPSYFGWIAAQFVALAGMLHLFFDIDPRGGILLVAVVGTGYTLMGGMWSVTLTDAVQIALVLVGLIVMLVVCLTQVGDGSAAAGIHRIWTTTPPQRLVMIPHERFGDLLTWLSVFIVGALGNVPVQDLMQRVFAAKSARVASWACVTAGVAYLTFGAIPVILALCADHLVPHADQQSILPILARTFLSPAMAVIFIVALMSAVLSTIDSAMLSPASILAHNVFPRSRHNESVFADRVAVVLVALCSTWFAYQGENAYAMLESAYGLTLVGLFVPLVFSLKGMSRSPGTAISSMLAGTLVWLLHQVLGWDDFLAPLTPVARFHLPVSLCCLLLSLVVYVNPPGYFRRTAPAVGHGSASSGGTSPVTGEPAP